MIPFIDKVLVIKLSNVPAEPVIPPGAEISPFDDKVLVIKLSNVPVEP